MARIETVLNSLERVVPLSRSTSFPLGTPPARNSPSRFVGHARQRVQSAGGGVFIVLARDGLLVEDAPPAGSRLGRYRAEEEMRG